MFPIDRFGLFVVTVLMVNLTPGATFVAVTSGAMSRGLRAGIYTALGAFCGLLVYAIACWAGLTKIMSESVFRFNIVRYVGVVCLFYFSLQAFMQKPPALHAMAKKKIVHHFRKGLVVNLFNPFTALLFLTIIPQFLPTDTENLSLKILFLGLWISCSALTVNLAYAVLFGFMGKYLMRFRFFWKWQGVLTGFLFLYLGIRFAFFNKSRPYHIIHMHDIFFL